MQEYTDSVFSPLPTSFLFLGEKKSHNLILINVITPYSSLILFLSPSSLKPALLDLSPRLTSLLSVKRLQFQAWDHFGAIFTSSHVYVLLPLTRTMSWLNEHSGCNVSEQSALYTVLTIKTHLTAICGHFRHRSCCEKSTFLRIFCRCLGHNEPL